MSEVRFCRIRIWKILCMAWRLRWSWTGWWSIWVGRNWRGASRSVVFFLIPRLRPAWDFSGKHPGRGKKWKIYTSKSLKDIFAWPHSDLHLLWVDGRLEWPSFQMSWNRSAWVPMKGKQWESIIKVIRWEKKRRAGRHRKLKGSSALAATAIIPKCRRLMELLLSKAWLLRRYNAFLAIIFLACK